MSQEQIKNVWKDEEIREPLSVRAIPEIVIQIQGQEIWLFMTDVL